MSFSSLGLAESLLRAVTEHGYTTPTPIQLQAIPAVLNGGDLLAGAQTGTGKTAGFVLPMLQRLTLSSLAKPSAMKIVRALILTPTRELAAQVEESVRVYGKYTKLTSTVIFGGVGINPQISQLRRGVDIVVATPGRLLDLHQQRAINLSHVEILVLDEADRMLDMGFIHDIKRVLKLLPAGRQNLLFSATFSNDIKTLADSLLNNPALIEVARRNSTVEAITQKVHPVDRDKKRQLLSHLIKTQNWHQVLVFTRTKHGANRLAELLIKDGITALVIHGNKSQGARTKALAEFKSGDLQVLVATDIAARGIDIDQLPHVVNYDLPNVPEDYVHRIGRTGRAGASGEAISLVCIDEAAFLHAIERMIKREIPVEVIAGFEPDPKAKAEPIQLRSPGHRPARGGARPGQHKQSKSGSGTTQKPSTGKRPATTQRFGNTPGQGKKPSGRGGGNSR
jgi:ATP-dependent RNA helicase RhlE